MKNERLVQAFGEARPDEAAKKRMLAGILAQQDAPEIAKRPPRRIRRTLLIAAAVCMVVSTVRKRWYGAYMSDLETLADCLCEREAAA